MNIQISVVIPTYRRPALLFNCLQALSHQNFDPERMEIIVVSDGPDPETETAVRQWPQVRYLALLQKKGPAAARNYGWLHANSSLVAFTDDDCLPHRDWLSSFYESSHQPNAVAMTGQTLVPQSSKPTDYEQNIIGLQTADFITANCCCTKKALIIVGGFDERFEIAWREDSDLEFKLLRSGIPIYKIDSAIVTHPIRPATWGISIKEQRKTLYNALLYKKHPRLYREKIQPTPPILYYMIIIAFAAMFGGGFFQNSTVLWMGVIGWLGLSALFAFKRLHKTTLAPAHLLEMMITSLCIPFISIYWQWYGAVKYRVLFL